MARVSRDDIESRWYDCFSGWTHADREAAMKVLATLHRHLPADPKAKPPKPDKPATNGQPAATLLDGQTESEAI